MLSIKTILHPTDFSDNSRYAFQTACSLARDHNAGDHTLVTLCPGGKERLRRLMNVVESGRADLRPLVTHRFRLDRIEEAYELFSNQRDGVLKVAITP